METMPGAVPVIGRTHPTRVPHGNPIPWIVSVGVSAVTIVRRCDSGDEVAPWQEVSGKVAMGTGPSIDDGDNNAVAGRSLPRRGQVYPNVCLSVVPLFREPWVVHLLDLHDGVRFRILHVRILGDPFRNGPDLVHAARRAQGQDLLTSSRDS
jgi:hypothetical protein